MYSGYKMTELSKNKKTQAMRVAYIPPFELKTTFGETFTNKDLKASLPVVFFYFNSECDFCQVEIQDVLQNIKKFENIQLVFVSFESIQNIILFQVTYKLDIYDNVIFLSDYKNNFSETFGVKGLPSSLVYNKNGKLVSKNNGAVSVDYLLKSLNRN